jgi:hypothetical protein
VVINKNRGPVAEGNPEGATDHRWCQKFVDYLSVLNKVCPKEKCLKEEYNLHNTWHKLSKT